MTAKQRRRSTLADSHPAWSAPAHPTSSAPAPAAPATPAAPDAESANAHTAAARGHAQDQDEALGRVAYRNAALAWASAERKALQRMASLNVQTSAALGRGTPPATLGQYLLEACVKHGIDPNLLPAAIRTAAGLDSAAGPAGIEHAQAHQ